MVVVRRRRREGITRGRKGMGLGLMMVGIRERVLLRLLEISTATAGEAATLERIHRDG